MKGTCSCPLHARSTLQVLHRSSSCYLVPKVWARVRVKMLAAHIRVMILSPIFPIFVCKQFKMLKKFRKNGTKNGKRKIV